MTPLASFAGDFTRRVDGKNRGLLPRPLVRALDGTYGSLDVVIADFGTHLRLYPAATWPLQQEMLREHLSADEAERIVRGAHRTKVQKNGRFPIKAGPFLAAAGAERTIRVVGHPTSIRVEWLPAVGAQLALGLPERWEPRGDDGSAAGHRGRGRPARKEHVVEIPLGDLVWPDDAFRMRGDVDLRGLSRSLKEEGQKLPIYVMGERPYRVIAGHLRVEALRRIGAESVRAVILPRMSETEARRVALIDNLEHHALSEADILFAVRKLHEQGMHADEIGQLLRRKIRTAQRLIRVAQASEEILDAIRAGRLTVSAAYEVLTRGIPLERVLDRGTGPRSVRALKAWRAGAESDHRRRGVHIRRFRDGGFRLSVHVRRDVPEDQRREVERLLADALSQVRAQSAGNQ